MGAHPPVIIVRLFSSLILDTFLVLVSLVTEIIYQIFRVILNMNKIIKKELSVKIFNFYDKLNKKNYLKKAHV